MLVQFSVSNWRSIRDKQTLSLVQSTSNELLESNTFDAEVATGERLLRSAVLYGPNASGKSNLLRALRAMQSIILHSSSK